MGIKITEEFSADHPCFDSEQPKSFDNVILLGEMSLWPEDLGQEQPSSNADFKRDLRKSSRKIKK